MHPFFFAQASAPEPIGPTIIQALSNNGFWVFVGICVLAATAKNIVSSILKHRERIAMIEAGMTLPHETADEGCAAVGYETKRRA